MHAWLLAPYFHNIHHLLQIDGRFDGMIQFGSIKHSMKYYFSRDSSIHHIFCRWFHRHRALPPWPMYRRWWQVLHSKSGRFYYSHSWTEEKFQLLCSQLTFLPIYHCSMHGTQNVWAHGNKTSVFLSKQMEHSVNSCGVEHEEPSELMLDESVAWFISTDADMSPRHCGPEE